MFHFIVGLLLEAYEIGAELQERLRTKKVGGAIVATHGMFARDSDLRKLETALSVERVVSYRPTKEEDADLRAVVVEHALERYRAAAAEHDAGSAYAYDLPTPPPELGLPALDTDRWEDVLRRVHQATIERTRQLVVPAASGLVEKGLRWLVWGDLTDHWKRWEAAKRTGVEISTSGHASEGGEDGEDDDYPSPLTDQTGDDGGLAAHRHGGFSTHHHGGRPTRHDGGLAAGHLALAEAEKLFAQAQAAWGEPGVVFLRALFEDRPLAEASAAAGVSRQTGRAWRKKLRALTPGDPAQPEKV